MARQAEPLRVHQLNNTASMVLALCDGKRTLAGIAEVLAEAFTLKAPPLAEAAACVTELRRAGVLVDHAHYPTKIRVVFAQSAHPEAESRTR
jgi:Coenzyme PQQ synthesis protein D (PqqD)